MCERAKVSLLSCQDVDQKLSGKSIHATSINDKAGGYSHDAVAQYHRSCRLICSEEGYLYLQHDSRTCSEICAVPYVFSRTRNYHTVRASFL